jgi:hypothetical protein
MANIKGIIMKKDITKKQSGNQKTFQDEANNSGSRKHPIPQVKEYATGLKYKKAAPALAKKKPVAKGK